MNTKITAEKGKQDINVERIFKASPNQVYHLFTDPDLIVQWQGNEFRFITFDGRNGGNYESSHIGPDGNTYGFKGVYHELIPNQTIIRTSEFLGLPFKVIPTLEIYQFEPLDVDLTQLTIQIICNSEEVRDAMVQHGMQAQFDTIFSNADKLLHS